MAIPKYKYWVFTLAGLALAFFIVKNNNQEKKQVKITVPKTLGVGALGRIEPQSRVIKLSHDVGPEGVRIESILVLEGQDVQKGEAVAIFSDYNRKKAKLDVAEAEVSILEAKLENNSNQLEFSDKEFKRAKALFDKKAIAKSDFEKYELALKGNKTNDSSIKAEIIAAKARLFLAEEELKQASLISPIDATVIKINARAGERVGDNGIVEIADLSKLEVVAEVYERDIPKISINQECEITVPGFNKTFKGKVNQIGYQVFKNDINNTDPLADRDNRTVEVRIDLNGQDSEKFKHLLFMKVEVRFINDHL
ncbi:MAG: efflux RND transporter periplasmic adaptor subunit [Alphaproteobacteria bacterium]